MMGRLNQDQGQLFYSFCLADAVPDDHPIREIAAVLDLTWVYAELAPHYPRIGRPSVDPVLMLRILIIGYLFAIRSERALCREVKVNLAYRWFCGLFSPGPMRRGGIDQRLVTHGRFSIAPGPPMTTLRIELERGQLARTRSLRGQLSAERIQDFAPQRSSWLMRAANDVAPRNNDAV
jgi:hypothetical protein